MAEAAVSYVLCKLADALLKKAQELHDVRGQMDQMQLELGFIKAYLRDADSKQHKGNELVKIWVNSVRDMAYKIEDVIDTFLVEIEENCPKTNSFFSIMLPVAKKPKMMSKLVGELEEITQKLNIIYQRGTDLGIKDLGVGTHEEPFRPTKPSEIDDSEVVGLEADKHQIMKQLLDRYISRRTVLSIVGTGGLGKTTLAQKVYKGDELKGQFDCRKWLSISQKFNLNDLLREILYSIEPNLKNKSPPIADEDLPEELKSSLENKRYLIVLDDVWTIDLWERLKIQLPDSNNASRVIITSRSLDVAKAADCSTSPYKLSYLNEDESLALLFRKAFQQHIQPENYPPDLLEVAKKLTKKCGGLPLGLVVLGGILVRRERTYTAWSTLEETMDWHNEDGKKCSQVLAMSYEDLPYDLKPCFLYFASFPEDHKISGKHVKRMWLAEGFIPKNRAEGFIPKNRAGTMEDRAEEFLQELVQRCLIQVTVKSWNGCCKYCSMHDLLRDLAIREAEEEKFFTVFSNVQDCNHLDARKPRRAALQFCSPTKDGVYSENTRALLCFSFHQRYSSINNGFILLNYSGLRLLRVLTIEHVDMRNFNSSKWLKDMIHLRYLGFRYCEIEQNILEKNSFYNLETIDLTESTIGKGTKKTTNHVVVPTLRHVYGNRHLEKICPLKWDHLTNLQTLKSVGHQEVPYLGGCINLRTFGVHYWMEETSPCDKLKTINFLEEWETLKGVLIRTKQLISLRIVVRSVVGFIVPFGGTRGLPCHEKIQCLYLAGELGGPICVPNVEMFPTNLTKLRLECSRLWENPMPLFERLQSLRILQLRQHSYLGTELICSTRGLPKLEKLEIGNMPYLRHWYIKEGAMPILSHLKIDGCWMLLALPELQNVPTLKELLVCSLSPVLEERMQGEDYYKIENIPSVRHVRQTSSK
ncbi:putative disease resistance RPP13-like protein 3 [Carex rostrata]